jgi:DNA (cytosine-5)-methyltransferase 1
VNVLDLVSGIGGFSLGLERAGMRTIGFCEIDPFCRAVLKKHWPNVPCHDDIRTLHIERGFADVITAGFPCQPHSSAARGRRRGIDDDRWLWPEVFRIIEESRPSWFIGENVTQLDGVALEQVVSDLESIDYQVQTFEIPACAVGLDHWRARLWILGHSNSDGKSELHVNAEVARLSGSRLESGSTRATDGISGRMVVHRRRVIGNAVVPKIPEIIGRAIMNPSVPSIVEPCR